MTKVVEAYVTLSAGTHRVGTLHRTPARRRESVSFEYRDDWRSHDERCDLDPALAVGKGRYYPEEGREMFGAIGDSAPDTRGRQLMRPRERRVGLSVKATPSELCLRKTIS